MTVRELMDTLATMRSDALVVMSRDSEGNGYAPLRVVDEAMYLDGEVDDPSFRFKDGVNAVVFWP